MTVFDVNKQTIVGDVKDLKRVHGVLAVPELHRVYASATGANELVTVWISRFVLLSFPASLLLKSNSSSSEYWCAETEPVRMRAYQHSRYRLRTSLSVCRMA